MSGMFFNSPEHAMKSDDCKDSKLQATREALADVKDPSIREDLLRFVKGA